MQLEAIVTFVALRESTEEGGGLLFEMQVHNVTVSEFKKDVKDREEEFNPSGSHPYSRSSQSEEMSAILSEHSANFVMLSNGQVCLLYSKHFVVIGNLIG